MLPAGICKGNSGSYSASPTWQPKSTPNRHQHWRNQGFLLSLVLERLPRASSIFGGIDTATLGEVRLAAATAAEDMDCATHQITGLDAGLGGSLVR